MLISAVLQGTPATVPTEAWPLAPLWVLWPVSFRISDTLAMGLARLTERVHSSCEWSEGIQVGKNWPRLPYPKNVVAYKDVKSDALNGETLACCL